MDPKSAAILEAIQPGSIFLGAVAACILYGITCLQTYIFFCRGHKDSWFFRSLIYILWVLDTIHMALVIHGIYFYLISNFGNAPVMLRPTRSLLVHVYFTIASDLIIRAIFGRRVWVLSHSYLLTGSILLTTLACALTGMIFVSKAFPLRSFSEFQLISGFLYASLGSGVVVDILIAVSLCVGLSKTRTGFKRTDGLVTILMAYTINTTVLTTLCSIACFITYAVFPQRLIFLAVYFCLSKLYFNSLLATLNARQFLREKVAGLSIQGTSSSISGTLGSNNPLDNIALQTSPRLGGGGGNTPNRLLFQNQKEDMYLEDGPGQRVLVNIDRQVTVQGGLDDDKKAIHIGEAV